MTVYSQVSPHTNTASPRLYLLHHFPDQHFELEKTADGWIISPSWEFYQAGQAQPTAQEVLDWIPPAPPLPVLSPIEQLFLQVQAKLDRDEFTRTGKEVDPKGAISVARAWAATAMLFNGWHYPSVAALAAGDNPALLAAIYADPNTNTTADSPTDQKRKVLHFTLVMLEGQSFGLEYAAELSAYERTASGQIRVALQVDGRDWMSLPCGPYATVRDMFLQVLK